VRELTQWAVGSGQWAVGVSSVAMYEGVGICSRKRYLRWGAWITFMTEYLCSSIGVGLAPVLY
jgi:hypothetical protein